MRPVVLLYSAVLLSGCGGAGGAVSLTSQDDSASYLLGFQTGQNLQRQHVPIDVAAYHAGVRRGFAGESVPFPDSVGRPLLAAFQQRVMLVQQQQDSIQAEAQEREGAQFLGSNRDRQGVRTTASGLQYEVLTEGRGPRPGPTSRVTVHYQGTLLDGTVFDDSRDRGEPASFALDQVIPGWSEGVQLMPEGSTFRFWVPGELGYGREGAPGRIPPNAVLVFDVELLDVQ